MTRYTYLIRTPTGEIYGITTAESEDECRMALIHLHGFQMGMEAEIELAPEVMEDHRGH